MNAGALDVIVGAFVSALQSGLGVLLAYSLPILAFCGLVAYCTTMWPVVLGGASWGGDGMMSMLLTFVRIGVFYWISVSLAALTLAAFHTFLLWGTAPSGGAFSMATFLSPSSMLDAGYKAARPIQVYLQNYDGWQAMWNFPTVVGYMLAFWLVVGAFALIAFHLIITIIEFHLAVMVGAVLIPWGALSQTAFLCEFSISFIVAGLIRILLTAAILSIGMPLFVVLKFTVTPGGDPTFYSAGVFALTAFIFAILAWQVPTRAAAVGGRGMALGLTGGVLLPHTLTGVANTVGSAAIRGTSRMLGNWDGEGQGAASGRGRR